MSRPAGRARAGGISIPEPHDLRAQARLRPIMELRVRWFLLLSEEIGGFAWTAYAACYLFCCS